MFSRVFVVFSCTGEVAVNKKLLLFVTKVMLNRRSLFPSKRGFFGSISNRLLSGELLSNEGREVLFGKRSSSRLGLKDASILGGELIWVGVMRLA